MATTIPNVSNYPDPAPERGDRTTFRTRADSMVSHNVTLFGEAGVSDGEMNEAIDAFNTVAEEVETARDAAQTAQSEAETAVTNAETAVTNAETARDYANDWATEDEDTAINDGTNPAGYSAYHWAQKSAKGERLTATSASSNTIGTGSKTFTLAESYRAFTAGSKVRVSETADPSTNYMQGIVTSYNDSTDELIVNVTDIGGSGTISAWSIGLSVGGDADSVNGYTLDQDVSSGSSPVFNAENFTNMPVGITVVASGALTDGSVVSLNSDGTVSVISVTADSELGTAQVFESATTTYISATFDSNSNRVVIAYTDAGNSNHGTAIVGEVDNTDNSISFGTPVVFESASTN